MQIATMLSDQHRSALNLPVTAELGQAMTVMSRSDATAAMILEDGLISGILTRGDILRCLVQTPCDKAKTLAIKQVMSSNPIFAGPEELVHTAIARMQAEDIAHLPVIHNEELAGLLSITDLLYQQIRQQRREIVHLQEYIESLQNAEHD